MLISTGRVRGDMKIKARGSDHLTIAPDPCEPQTLRTDHRGGAPSVAVAGAKSCLSSQGSQNLASISTVYGVGESMGAVSQDLVFSVLFEA